MASSDNPVGNLIDNLFSKKSKSTSDYLLKLSEFRSATGQETMERPSFLIKHTDPFGIFRRYGEFKKTKTIGTFETFKGATLERTKALGAFTEASARISSFMSGGKFSIDTFDVVPSLKTQFQKSLYKTFGKLSQVEGLELLQRGKEIYLGSAQLGFVPLPVQGARGTLEGGIVQIGGKRRGAYQLATMGKELTEQSYSEVFYNKLLDIVEGFGDKGLSRPSAAQEVLKKIKKISKTQVGIGATGKAVKLSELLAASEKIRGMPDTGLTAMYKGQQSIVVEKSFDRVGKPGEEFVTEIFRRRKDFTDAKRAISQITKSRGLSIPTELPFLQAVSGDQKLTAGQALRAAYNVMDRYTSVDLPAMYQKLGISGMSAMSKADFLVEAEKNLVVSATSAKKLFGAFFSSRAKQKGMHQLYKAAPVSKLEAKQIIESGGRPVPFFATEDELAQLPRNMVATRRPFRALVLDFNNDIASQLITQDAGALFTEKGLASVARRQYVGQLRFKGAGKHVLDAVETLIGSSALDAGATGRLNITRSEFIRASTFSIKRADLTQREKAIRRIAFGFSKTADGGYVKREGFGILEQLSRGMLPGGEGGVFVSSAYEQGTLRLNLMTKGAVASGSTGLVVGGVRLTGIATRSNHVLNKDLQTIGSLQKTLAEALGVDVVVAKTDFQKMATLDVFLENFHAVLERNGLRDQFAKELGKGTQTVVAGGGYTIATAASKGEAAKRAMRVVKKLRTMGNSDPKYKEIADQIVRKRSKGGEVNLARVGAAASLSGLSDIQQFAKAGTVVELPGFVRSDQRLDTNLNNRAKITLGKFKTLAFGSAMLGYKNAMEDPLVRDLAFQQKMFNWNPKKNDFVLGNDHPIKKFLRALADPDAVKLKESEIVRIKNGELYLGDKKLKALPDIAKFTDKSGGVSKEALKGTILDPDIGDFLYLDLGKKHKLNLLGQDINKKDILGGIEHRYIPIPKQLLRAEKAVDGRIVIGKTHPGYAAIKMLTEIEAGKSALSSVAPAMKAIFDKLGGKKGYLSKMHTVHLPAGFSGRLVPQQSSILGKADFANPEKIFEAAVSRQQLISAIETRKGTLGDKLYKKLIKEAKEEKFIYSMFMADPTQRAEHMSAFKLQLLDEPISSAGKVSVQALGMDIQMHPLAYKMVERDTDNDRIVINLLGRRNDVKIEDRIARQVKGIAPSLGYFEEKMAQAAASVTKVSQEALGELFSAFIGQKTFASLGYSQVRPTVERLLPTLLSEGVEGLRRAGISIGGGNRAVSVGLVEDIRGMFRGAFSGAAGTANMEKQLAGALNISQYLFQSGVKKGIGKAAQRELGIALIDIADSARQSFNLENVLKKSYEAFLPFVKGSDTSRIFQAGELLLESSTPKVLEGLVAGAQKGTQDYLERKAAALLSMTVGLGYGLSGKMSSMGTVAGFAEDTSIFQETGQIFKRIFGPLAGITRKSSGTAAASTESTAATTSMTKAVVPPSPSFGERMSKIKSDLFKDISDISKSKYFKPAAIGLAAFAGIGIVNRATAPEALSTSLPPPTDTTTPMDIGPTLPQMRTPPRINTSSFAPSAGRFRHNQKFGPVQTNLFDNRVDNRVIINDNTSSRQNSWLLRRQMDKESESDFAY